MFSLRLLWSCSVLWCWPTDFTDLISDISVSFTSSDLKELESSEDNEHPKSCIIAAIPFCRQLRACSCILCLCSEFPQYLIDFFFFLVCMPVCAHTYVWCAKDPIRCLSTSNLDFETGSLTDPRTHHMRQVGQQTPRILLCLLIASSLRVAGVCHHAVFIGVLRIHSGSSCLLRSHLTYSAILPAPKQNVILICS